VKNLIASIILVGFSSAAFAGNTIKLPTGCWVADSPGGKTAHWVDPCPGGHLRVGTPPAAAPAPNQPPVNRSTGDPLKGLNVSKSKGCWVPDGPNSNTAHWVVPCPNP